MTLDDIRLDISQCLFSESLVYEEDKGDIKGILLWDIESYIPLRVCIREVLTTTNGALGNLLQQLDDRMPPSYRVIAQRQKGIGIVEYKNPKRILKLIQNQKRILI
jgi:hypothetical protein